MELTSSIMEKGETDVYLINKTQKKEENTNRGHGLNMKKSYFITVTYVFF